MMPNRNSSVSIDAFLARHGGQGEVGKYGLYQKFTALPPRSRELWTALTKFTISLTKKVSLALLGNALLSVFFKAGEGRRMRARPARRRSAHLIKQGGNGQLNLRRNDLYRLISHFTYDLDKHLPCIKL